ncbi:hypothetical protein SLEP1_g23420 [Rubroshorea leprosula]|uniref:Cell number regulator 8-like n=1 Tax=Rubroshorea leprosula TaxID=152421 RepID=A0AAV5JCC2_9ROSI|nr:hypothetical protein SLEP1_g23420 [Rubroshorea leprosula]
MSNTGTDDHHEESSPLLSKQVEEDGSKESCNDKGNRPKEGKVDAASDLSNLSVGVRYSWAPEGLPLGHANVARGQWGSCLFACLGRNDEYCCSDLEVCIVGSTAPCVLYGSNAEGLISGPQTFRNHCLLYCGLCLIGIPCFSLGNRLCLPSCFSFPNRSALRRKFNLEGSCEALSRSCGCCGSCLEDDVQREHCESVCDLATHVFCHQCALCQEGRESRRRILHPGFNFQPLLAMIPPGKQTMGSRA